MKVILVSGAEKNWNGGASSVFLYLDRELKRLGAECSLYNADDFHTGAPRSIAKLFFSWLVARRVYAAARSANVVEVSGGLGWLLFRRLRKLPEANRPLLVVRLHGLEYKDEQARIVEEIARHMKLPIKYKFFNRHWINFQEFESLRLADRVICHTSRELDAIVCSGLKEESKVSVMPLGVEARFVLHHDYPGMGNRLLWWGSWVERKGIFTLPRAFTLAAALRPDLRLTIGGTGMRADELLRLFPTELRSRVDILPFVPDESYLKILETHDIALFPSLSEGFGLAMLESMAAGLPCIVTLTGMYDWLEHGRNCYVIPMSAPTALARAIVSLSNDPERRKALGKAASATARSLTWASLAEHTLLVYNEGKKA